MRTPSHLLLLAVICSAVVSAQPAVPPPAPAAPVAPLPLAPAPEPPRGGGQGGADRGWRREGAQQPFPAAFMERLQQEHPDLHERLSRLYRDDRPKFLQEIRTLMRERGVSLNEAQGGGARGGAHRDSPEEQKCAELRRLYQEATAVAEKERLKAELASAIKAAFEVRLRTSKERVARLERQLLEFRQNLERLETNREKICAERLEELTEPAELRWDGNW